MDPEDLLNHISKNPLPPFNDGCAKKALKSFMWHLRVTGMYFEHRNYENWKNEHGYKKNLEEDGEKESPVHLISYSNQNALTPQMKLNSMDSSPSTEKRLAKTSLLNSVTDSGIYTKNKISTDITGNNTKVWKEIKDQHSPEPAEIFQEEENNLDASLQKVNTKQMALDNVLTKRKPLARSTDSPEAFFLKCGLVQKYNTQKIIESLNLNLTKSNKVMDTELGKKEGKPQKESWIKAIWSDRTYAFVVNLILWGYFFRCIIFLIDDHGINFMVLINATCWIFENCATTTSMFFSCARRDHFKEFFAKWAALFQDPVTNALGIRGVTSQKYMRFIIGLQWAITLINVANIIFIMMMEDSFSGGMNIVFYITGYRSNWVIAISSIAAFFCSFAWIAPVSFMTVLCIHVNTHFWEFNQVMKLHIAAAKTGFPRHFNLLRERHLAMCDAVGVLDRYVKVTMSFISSVSILLSCMGLYQLINLTMDTSVVVIVIFWIVSSFCLLGIITYHLANVNVAMHSVSDDLYTIQTKNVTPEQLGQLQLFLAKVNGPSMGFTILGMIVVTRELMLTLFSLYITYAVVLLQFK